MQQENGSEKTPVRSFGAVDVGLLALMLIWGYNMIVVKTALDEISPLAFNAVRFGLAAFLMTLVLAWREDDLTLTSSEMKWLFLTGLIGNTVYQVFFINGINLSTAGNTAFMVATAPVWVAVLSAVLKIEIPAPKGWIGILLSVSGVALIIIGGSDRIVFSSQTVWGDLLTLTGAICWAAYTLMTRPILKSRSPLFVTTYAMVFGAVPLLLLSSPAVLAQNWSAVSSEAWLSVLYASVFALVFGYVVWSWGVGSIGSTKTAIYSNLTPVVAGITGYLLLGETWTVLRALGAFCVLTGLYLVRTSPAESVSENGEFVIYSDFVRKEEDTD